MYQNHPRKMFIAQGLENYPVRPELLAECGYLSNQEKVVTHEPGECCVPIDTEMVTASHELVFRRHKAILEWAENWQVSVGLVTIEYGEQGSWLEYHTGIPTVKRVRGSISGAIIEFHLTLTDMGVEVFKYSYGDDDTSVIVGVLTEIPGMPHYNGKLTITEMQADKQFEFGPTEVS